ncbi:hypothetical protein [Pandoravirus japonicus]|uniref:Uncharacterized protein n=1 Tax=Pandoravirus japonicus TaxID=2823154 RepID=A0A811BP71_9VIRU|nr:hypothetical protein [Pandoravirus japonicus]
MSAAQSTRQRSDGSATDIDIILDALWEIKADGPYAVLTTIDPHSGRPVSRAVRPCDCPVSGADFGTVRVMSSVSTRTVHHASVPGATACMAYMSTKHNACFTLTGRVTSWCMDGDGHPVADLRYDPISDDPPKAVVEIAADTIEVVSHGHRLSTDLDGRQPIVLTRTAAVAAPFLRAPTVHLPLPMARQRPMHVGHAPSADCFTS